MDDGPSRELIDRAIGVIAGAERICREAAERVAESRRLREDAAAIRRDAWSSRSGRPEGSRGGHARE